MVSAPIVYLAGKIYKNDWRHAVVDGLSNFCSETMYEDPTREWPVLHRSIKNKISYSGPYFIGCDHGCSHGKGTHGYDVGCMGSSFNQNEFDGDYNTRYERRQHVVKQCKNAIDRSDYVFAWLDDLTAFGTLFEIGYAIAKEKRVCFASPRGELNKDLWFVEDSLRLNENENLQICADNALMAFDSCTEWIYYKTEIDLRLGLIESPIEKMFFCKCLNVEELWEVQPQYEIASDGRSYRADFALPDKKIVFELDGHEFHKSKEQRTNDARRERAFQKQGWKVVRFTGTEIYNNLSQCVRDAAIMARGIA